MIRYLLALALFAQATPDQVEEAITDYHVQQTHEAEQEDHARRQEPQEGPSAAPTASLRLIAIIRPGSTSPLREAASGEKLILLGENLPPGGTIRIARREATITRQTPTFYELTAPRTATVLTGPVDLFVGTLHRARLPNVTFTLRPAPPEPVSERHFPPQVVGYRNEAGAAVRGPQSGSTALWIDGYGFGTARGQVWVGAEPVAVLAWSETSIRVRLPVGRAAGAREESVTVFPVGRRGITAMGFEVVR